VGIGAYGGTCVVLAHWILCMERGTGYFARAPFRKPRSAFVGVRAFTLRQLFCPGQRRQRAAALPKTPCRASVMIPLTTSGAASRAGATEQGAPHEVGLDPVVVAADAATRRRFAVPEHHPVPGSARPVAARPAGRRRSDHAPPRQRPVGRRPVLGG